LAPGALRDDVDACAARDAGDGQRAARLSRQLEPREPCDGDAERVDGVGAAPVGPGVAAGAGDRGAQPARAEGAVYGAAAAGAVERDEGGGLTPGRALAEQVLHAAQVAGALLADGRGEDDGRGGADAGLHE